MDNTPRGFEIRRVWKQSGSSHAVTLPKDMCDELNIKDGTYIAMEKRDDSIIIRTVKLEDEGRNNKNECGTSYI